jgi:hypothetical protein
MALTTCHRRVRNWTGPRRGVVELSMTREQCEALIAATRAAFPDLRGELAPRRVRVGAFHRCEAWNVMHYWHPPRRVGGSHADGDRWARWLVTTHLRVPETREAVNDVKRQLLAHLACPVPGISAALFEVGFPVGVY